MTVTYINNGNGTIDLTVLFNDANKVKADQLLTDAARYAYENMGIGDHGTEEAPKTWVDLTNNQRLQLIEVICRNHLIELARAYHVTTATNTAQSTAQTEAPTRYEI